MKEIVEEAVSKECLKAAESYLQLKPWVYGTVTTSTLLACCIDVAREKTTEEAQLNVMLVAVSTAGGGGSLIWCSRFLDVILFGGDVMVWVAVVVLVVEVDHSAVNSEYRTVWWW